MNMPLRCDFHNGWEDVQGHCYKSKYPADGFNDALVQCALDDAYLVVIDSVAENQFVFDVAHGDYESVWIGLTEETHAGEWSWVYPQDPNSNYTNWSPDASMDMDGFGAAAISKYEEGKWSSEKISEELNYVCEKPQGTCATGWKEFEEHCYYFNTEDVDEVTWETANATCSSVGAYLVIVGSISEDAFIRTTMAETETLWLGLSSVPHDAFYWIDGTTTDEFTQMNADVAQTALDSDDRKCAYLRTTESDHSISEWIPVTCEETRHYVCEAAIEDPITMIPPQDGYYCPKDWHEYRGHCYGFGSEEETWTTARLKCQESGGDLASITTWQEQDFIHLKSSDDSWIGLNDREEEGKYSWSDGTKVNILNWDSGEPSKGDSNCVEQKYSSGKWNDVDCNEKKTYICKRHASATSLVPVTPSPTPPGSKNCGWNWIENQVTGECYRFYTDRQLSFQDANSYCKEVGYHSEIPSSLVTINSAQESLFLETQLSMLHISDPTLWIGLQNDRDGMRWVDGSVAPYTNWNENEPNKYYSENCIEMATNNYKWNDAVCSLRRGFICEKKGDAYVKPTPFPPPDVLCPEGWVAWDNYCYYFSKETATWDTAHTYCQSNYGSILASIKNADENDFIFKTMKGGTSINTWIGLHDDDKGKKWRWVDDSDFIYYKNWADGEPNHHNNAEHCGELRTTSNSKGKWNDMTCYTRNYYVCKMTVRTCPEGWILEKNKCYYASNYPDTWSGAQKRCREMNSQADLASIHSDDENKFLKDMLDPGTPATWIGLLYQYEKGTWKWSDGTDSSYLHWNQGEPNNIGSEFCGEMIHDSGFWNNLKCGESRNFACEVLPTHIVGCEPEWVHSKGYCYYFNYKSNNNKASKDFDEAQKECIKLDSNLVSIHSLEENDVVYSLLQQYYSYGVWIGLRNEKGKGYSWMDKTPVTYTSWDTEYSYKKKPCVYFSGSTKNNRWDKDLCANKKHYLCKKPAETRPIDSIDPSCKECQNRVKRNAPNVGRPDSAQTNWTPKSSSSLSSRPPVTTLPPSRLYLSLLNTTQKHPLRRLKRHAISSGSETPPFISFPSEKEEKEEEENPNSKLALGSSEESLADAAKSSKHIFTHHHRFGEKPAGQDDLAFPLANIVKTTQAYIMIYGSTESSTPLTSNKMTTSSPPLQSPRSSSSTSSSSASPSPSSSTSSDSSSPPSSTSSSSSPPPSRPITQSPTAFTSPSPSPSPSSSPSPSPSPTPARTSVLSTSSESDTTQSTTNPDIQTTLSSLSPTVIQGNSDQTPDWTSEIIPTVGTTSSKAPEYHNFCIKGDVPYKTSCYKISDTKTTWYDAKRVCQQNVKGNLVVVNDRFEGALLSAMLIDVKTTAWIGLSTSTQTGGMDFGWVNGDPVLFTNWDEYEPDTSHGTCVSASGESSNPGLWKVGTCTEKNYYVCEYDREGYTTPPPPTTTPEPKYCRDGWERFSGKCYKVFQNPVTWEKAEEKCVGFGGHLTSVHSVEEQNFIHNLDGVSSIDSRLVAIWVGLSMLSDEEGYEWSDSSALNHLNWAEGQPDSHNGRERCVAVNRVNFQYSDYVCESYKPFICKTPEGLVDITTVAPVTPIPDVFCNDDSSWLLFSNHCYKIYFASEASTSWAEARRLCADEGSDLVSIHSYEENYWILSKAYKKPDRMLWAGGRAFYDSGFSWVDGSTFDFVNWAVDEPNNYHDQEDCMSFYSFDNGYWNDMNCGNSFGRICKRPHGSTKPPPSPTPPPVGQCPQGWIRLRGKCHYFSGQNVTASFEMARDACRALDPKSDLVSIHSEAESGFMTLLAGSDTSGVWIGLRKESGTFVWTDNSVVDYTNWAFGEPNDNENDWKLHIMRLQVPPPLKRVPGKSPFIHFIKKKHDDRYLFGDMVDFLSNRDVEPYPVPVSASEEMSMKAVPLDTSGRGNLKAGVMPPALHLPKTGSDPSLSSFPASEVRRSSLASLSSFSSSESTLLRSRRKRKSSDRQEHCVEVLLTRDIGKWNDVFCDKEFPFICQLPLDSSIATPAPVLMCDEPYNLYESFADSCYRFISEPKTWQEAEDACVADGAHLVSIQDLGTNSYLWSVMQNLEQTEAAWIGLNSIKSKDEFVWTDGWPTVYTFWGNWEPNVTAEDQRCASMNSKDGRWRVQSCNDSRSFFCMYSETLPPTPDTPVDGKCPDTRWMDLGGGFCYLIVRKQMSWSDANWQCLEEYSNLVSIHSVHERDLLLKSIKDITDPIWIGLTQRGEDFGWTDGTAMGFVDWETGEPNNKWEKCVEMYTTKGSWNDVTCGSIRSFVCKTPKIVPTTPPPPPTSPIQSTIVTPAWLPGGIGAGGIVGIVIACLFIVVAAGFIAHQYFNKPKPIGPNATFGIDNALYSARDDGDQVAMTPKSDLATSTGDDGKNPFGGMDA
ncbi:lymphocyte antigen 75-like isoform X2 [Oratosquilla oratoria]|uniref:lymphocyte antigen 75-like isoform X2 n=1 Tax=Oratosquilla oratoria TaxID=337810 RepID=UPI003F76F199